MSFCLKPLFTLNRRFEPMDSGGVLDDISVPFTVDLQALIEFDYAPNLESTLYLVFDLKRLNRVNQRKEFFRVPIEDIEKELNNIEIEALSCSSSYLILLFYLLV